jgi:hypothetical protein
MGGRVIGLIPLYGDRAAPYAKSEVRGRDSRQIVQATFSRMKAARPHDRLQPDREERRRFIYRARGMEKYASRSSEQECVLGIRTDGGFNRPVGRPVNPANSVW